MLPGMELMSCPEMAIPREVMQHVVHVESSFNPYAIGVVGGRLVRQPKNLSEALSTVRMLEQRGFNFSIGIAQVNRYNLAKYGLTSYAHAFEICPNLQAGARILAECYQRHQDWGKSFSCYYSGNPVTGFRHGYVQKVFNSMAQAGTGTPRRVAAADGIEVVGKSSRRVVPVEHFPLQADNRTEVQPSRRSSTEAIPRPIVSDPAFVGSSQLSRTVPAPSAAAFSEPSMATSIAPPTPVSTGNAPVRLQATPGSAAPVPAPSATVPLGDGAFVF